MIKEVRSGLGFLAGIDLVDEILASAPGIVGRWQQTCREAGVLVLPLGNGIAVSPPLIVGRAEIDELCDGLLQGLELLERELAAAA
jgi:putrescine aminotransferase